MSKSTPVMRRAILSRLFEHLEGSYSIDVSKEMFIGGTFGTHQIDAVLAFKSDARIDELRGALGRLEDGTYGKCIRCKRPMPQPLLDEDPARRFCAECEHDIGVMLGGVGVFTHIT